MSRPLRFGTFRLRPTTSRKRAPRDSRSSALCRDVAHLGRDVARHQGGARERSADLLRRGALPAGLRGVAGRGARRAWRADRPACRPRHPQRRAGQRRHLCAALLGHAVRCLRRRRRREHVDEPGLPVRIRHPAGPRARELASPHGARSRHRRPGDPVLRQGEFHRERNRAVGRRRDCRGLGVLFARLRALASSP